MSEIEPPPPLVRGSAAFLRMNLALVAAGLATFAQLYSVQPLLPIFARTFRIDAATASLAVSVCTTMLATVILFTGVIGDRFDRRKLMTAALIGASVFTFCASIAPTWPLVLLARALTGLSLAGVPAVALTYIGEEVESGSVGLAVGLQIGGNVFGGMAGRLTMGVIADHLGWRWALAVVALVGFVSAVLMWLLLPPSKRFHPRARPLSQIFGAFAAPFRDAGIPWLTLVSALCMGAFVTVYNYIGFRLLGPPYNLSQTAVGLVFICYLTGIVSSPLIGDLGGRFGRRRVLWPAIAAMLLGAVLTAARPLPVVIAGIALFTFSFFGSYSNASSWMSRRAGAARAQASALFLFFYYLGGSVCGTLGGYAWSHFGWTGVVSFVGALLAVATAVAVGLAFLEPLPGNEPPARSSGRKGGTA